MKMIIRAGAALILAAGLALGLTGCSKTVTVTSKYRSAVGLYFICDGPSFAPCIKGDVYRVSQAEYDKAVVGKAYTIKLF
jgi:hypothetical protein